MIVNSKPPESLEGMRPAHRIEAGKRARVRLANAA
jgi:hypothetical protein